VNKRNIKKTIFIYHEKFKTIIPNPTEQDLKHLFNKKYFLFIKKNENRILRGCKIE